MREPYSRDLDPAASATEGPVSDLRTWWPHPPPLGRWIARIAFRRDGGRGRRFLASLDDRMLRDIGIDRCTVDRESTVSFWRML